MQQDFVIYSDTDSLFIGIGNYIKSKIGNKWDDVSDDVKIRYINEIANVISNYVNDKCYKDVQKGIYHSVVDDFKIKWKQEIIAKSGIFLAKKHYALWNVDEEGVKVDKMKSTGIEIVRSDTPSAIKPFLTEVVESILRGISDNDLKKMINRHKKELFSVYPEEIAVNISVSDIEKYVTDNNKILKGAPWHAKGVANYRLLLKHLDVENKYENITSKTKVKVVYLKKNILKMDSVSFLKWPDEFDSVVQIDYQKHINKYYEEKVNVFLKPMNKDYLLSTESSALDSFF
jgi:DNA polymerase elongation subunit (family B)